MDVITYPFGNAPDHPGVTVHRCRQFPFVRSVRIGFSAAKLLTDISLASCAMRLFRRTKYDCIHGVEEGVFIAVALGRRSGAPVIYDMDSIMSSEIASGKLGRIPLVVKVVRAAERWAIRHSSLVMTICDAMAEYVRHVDRDANVVVIPDVPVSPGTGGPDPERARAQLPPGCLRDRKAIVYTGSLAAYQGMDMLVSAMPAVIARHPEAMLLVVGGDDESVDRLSRLADDKGVLNHILFLGKRPPEQVPDFLGLADVLVSPRRGGINPPGKLYSYMQSGRPIVATHIPAHLAVLDWTTAVLTEPIPTGIADGLCWALAHPEKVAARGEKAREVVSGLTPEYQAMRIREAYDSLLTGTAPEPASAQHST